MDRGASWVTVHGVAESDTIKRLTGSVFSFTPSVPSIWYPLVTVNPAYFIPQTPLSALPLALSQVRGGHNFFLDNSESSPKQALVPLLQVLPTRSFDTWLPEPSCPTTFWLCFCPADNTSWSFALRWGHVQTPECGEHWPPPPSVILAFATLPLHIYYTSFHQPLGEFLLFCAFANSVSLA